MPHHITIYHHGTNPAAAAADGALESLLLTAQQLAGPDELMIGPRREGLSTNDAMRTGTAAAAPVAVVVACRYEITQHNHRPSQSSCQDSRLLTGNAIHCDTVAFLREVNSIVCAIRLAMYCVCAIWFSDVRRYSVLCRCHALLRTPGPQDDKQNKVTCLSQVTHSNTKQRVAMFL